MELRAEEGSAQQNTILRGRLPRHAAVWVDHFTICVLNSVQFRMILSTLLETKQLIWFATCVVNCTCPLLAMITILYSPTFVPYEGHLTYDVSLFFNKYVTCDRNQNFRRWPTRSSRSYFLRTPDHNHTAAAKAVWGACRDCCRDGSAAGRAFFFFLNRYKNRYCAWVSNAGRAVIKQSLYRLRYSRGNAAGANLRRTLLAQKK